MSEKQLIPNAVGRLDDVVEAIRQGRRDVAIELLVDRERAVLIKKETFEEQADKAKSEFHSIHRFLIRFARHPEFAERVRLACGGETSEEDNKSFWAKMQEDAKGGDDA